MFWSGNLNKNKKRKHWRKGHYEGTQKNRNTINVLFIYTSTFFVETGKKTLRLGAIPTVNPPQRSCESIKSPERRNMHIVKEQSSENCSEKIYYRGLADFSNRVSKLKLSEWDIIYESSKVVFRKIIKPYVLPQYEVVIDDGLGFSITIFGWLLPNDHEIYKKYLRSVRKITISKLLVELQTYQICNGIQHIETPALLIHSVPCEVDFDLSSPIQAKIFKRPVNCSVLESSTLCKQCDKFISKFEKEKRLKDDIINMPAKPNAPLTTTHKNRVTLALKQERKKSAGLERQLQEMEAEIKLLGVEVDRELSSDINEIMKTNIKDASPFMQLFWEEQNKNFSTNPNARKYHPMIIRFCLSLASKSASAYDELRNSNVLILPSRRTLRDYKNVIRPKTGFNSEVVEELVTTAAPLVGYQRFVVLSFDEIKVQENLVFDKHSGKLIGYVDLGDVELNYCTFQNVDSLATHALVYYVRGLASDMKHSLA